MINKPHFCPEWDGLLVSPGMPEMDACLCENEDYVVGPGSKVKTWWFTPAKEVTVKKMYRKKGCQTGWWIETDCGLGLDAGWFHE